ncbi:MAG: hypothetical protein QMD77_00565 [Patescibacteria group bacterium]|nr:hypothetical protein [Patescibacteria group bacterium]
MNRREKSFSPEGGFSAEENRIAEELEKINEIIGTAEGIKYWELTSPFIERLRDKYKEGIKNYLLYHILIGNSGEPRKKAFMFDFEGEDSIEKFIRKCHIELLPPRENDKAK